MNAIETRYKGYRFRSRLEARWAVFFDELGIGYEYEPEGFCTSDGTKYLPDFYLTFEHVYVEVKGKRYGAMDELHKAFRWVKESGEKLLILSDVPYNQNCSVWWFPCAYYHPLWQGVFGSYGTFLSNDDMLPQFVTNYVPSRDYLPQLTQYDPLSPWLDCVNDMDVDYQGNNFTVRRSYDCDRVSFALAKARGIRFEHGEQGGKQ